MNDASQVRYALSAQQTEAVCAALAGPLQLRCVARESAYPGPDELGTCADGQLKPLRNRDPMFQAGDRPHAQFFDAAHPDCPLLLVVSGEPALAQAVERAFSIAGIAHVMS